MGTAASVVLKGEMPEPPTERNFDAVKRLTDEADEFYQDLKFKSAFNFYKLAYEISVELGNKKEESQLLSNMGVICDHMQKYDEALEHYEEALKIKRQLKQDQPQQNELLDLATTLSNIGAVLRKMKRYKEAEPHYLE